MVMAAGSGVRRLRLVRCTRPLRDTLAFIRGGRTCGIMQARGWRSPRCLPLIFDIIENSGPDNLRDTLRSHLRRASEVSIAVAFVRQSGLDEIVQALRQVATRGNVRLLTGLYQKMTEPRA